MQALKHNNYQIFYIVLFAPLPRLKIEEKSTKMAKVMKKENLLFFIIFLEGYVVLSSELLAIRQIIPFAGSATDTVSIVIAAVLLPLTLGYYAGGQFKKRQENGQYVSIREKLLRNIFISTIFLIPAISYLGVGAVYIALGKIGITDRLAATSIYALIFLAVPVFFLAQTIPLVSNYFNKETLSRAAGRMLSLSTAGSFMGAIFSTLVLMAFLGVFNTAIITLLCLPVLFLCLSKRKTSLPAIIMVCLGVFSILLNSPYAMNYVKIHEANLYHTVKIYETDKGVRILQLNNNPSSSFRTDPNLPLEERTTYYRYAQYINDTFLKPIKKDGPVKSILVIGAGGFTLGLDDTKNEYIFLDISPRLKDIAENDFLKRPIGKNKTFHAVPARAFIHETLQKGKAFDLIVLDAYLGAYTIPEHLITAEFFSSVKDVTKDNGAVIMNFISSPTFNNAFSIKLDNTIRSVFPLVTRQVTTPYDGWSTDRSNADNIIYTYHKRNSPSGIYTDDKNRSYADKEKPVN